MANPFVHIELQTGDLARAKAFYSQLFDWKLEDLAAPEGGIPYTLINVGAGWAVAIEQANNAISKEKNWIFMVTYTIRNK